MGNSSSIITTTVGRTPPMDGSDIDLALCDAALIGDSETVRRSLERGATKIDTALSNAAISCHSERAGIIASVEICALRATEDELNMALKAAQEFGHPDMANALRAVGATYANANVVGRPPHEHQVNRAVTTSLSLPRSDLSIMQIIDIE